MNVNIVTLEDGKDYMIIYALDNENGKYIFMAEENNPKNLNLRKVIKKDDGKEYLVKLANEEEFDEVMIAFSAEFNKKEDKNE